ncbi:uncharacterized protein BO88DRAFT_404308 [Aspergillus vadensis CBS 113365]|uniref:Uncharacterized protein n=1 Tax=Aspergillus vadensis (strain CBS 113365 / IMI 142717 / IBT 24658) TaxID=1448311 RepID=A0A319BGK8_ASPVC|nr:hypothetical protein BO88DRAFT_404308 [Aspergillus vadensis CBS 113365]PYH69970.1 hypothetical protein BO88DRAFT_404308 [Aspergillus vadensis CBS 113365]
MRLHPSYSCRYEKRFWLIQLSDSDFFVPPHYFRDHTEPTRLRRVFGCTGQDTAHNELLQGQFTQFSPYGMKTRSYYGLFEQELAEDIMSATGESTCSHRQADIKRGMG